MIVHFIYRYKLIACLTNTKAKIDDSDTEEVDEINIINNNCDVVSDIDVVGWLRLILPFFLVEFVN